MKDGRYVARGALEPRLFGRDGVPYKHALLLLGQHADFDRRWSNDTSVYMHRDPQEKLG